jgi:hypothetical protein
MLYIGLVYIVRSYFTNCAFQEAAVAKQLSQVEGQQQPPAPAAPAQPASSVGTGGSVGSGGSGEGDPGNNHVSFRLVIQSSQCGSLIGKGGSKIKEIREVRWPKFMQ